MLSHKNFMITMLHFGYEELLSSFCSEGCINPYLAFACGSWEAVSSGPVFTLGARVFHAHHAIGLGERVTGAVKVSG